MPAAAPEAARRRLQWPPGRVGLFWNAPPCPALAILPIDAGRYGSAEIAAVFGEQKKIDYQLAVEAAAATAQAEHGVIPRRAGASIARAARAGGITPAEVRRLEKRTDHDTAALVKALSDRCPAAARPWVHYGLTSNDLVDTSASLQMRDALDVIEPKAARLTDVLAGMAARYAGLPAVGRTHGQHASIVSFGLKFANWASEMAEHMARLRALRGRALLCKMLGVVGTGSLMGADAVRVQADAAALLGLAPVEAATQVVPRERHAEYVFTLALVGSTLEKAAVEVRNLQRTEIGEVAEGFRAGQMGSSAVPVKRNPTKSERVTSLSRLMRSSVAVALENVPLWHERDLSNSANERFVIPTVSILLDESLSAMVGVFRGLSVDEGRIAANLRLTRGQIFAEFVLQALVKKGAPRMEAYRDVQRVAFAAAESGADYLGALKADRAVSSRLSPAELEPIFDARRHLGASRAIIRRVRGSARRAVAESESRLARRGVRPYP